MIEISNRPVVVGEQQHSRFRKTRQSLMPSTVANISPSVDEYEIYPYHSLGNKKIFAGYTTLAQWISQYKCVIIDGFSGVLWRDVQSCLEVEFKNSDTAIRWIHTGDFLKSEKEIARKVLPFLGERDSVWGTKTSLTIHDFFDIEQIQNIVESDDADITIVFGPGAALVQWDAPVIYLDVPKNEIQYRMRAGSVTNLGMSEPDEPAHMYKHYYFVDWVVLQEHRSAIKNRITVQGDVQWENKINWMFEKDLVHAIDKLSHSVLRVRPWFEPGAWGGHWMKERIDGLNKDEVNYAWSFELIVPENGLVFEGEGNLLEVPFDLLMLQASEKVLGKHAAFFGKEFPIRFDFLDTWDGGNLSIQCHPSLPYIRENFGEHITQDETYYILDCKENAQVYLGFQEGIDQEEFRTSLEESKEAGTEIDITQYVQSHSAKKHDLFLIPNGTVHSAGADNVVLEISSTPYIFTFKMYDWLRLDLNGEPRAINIEHAFKNLHFERQGDLVKQELISHPQLLHQQSDYECWHIPTHAVHFYDVHRLEFDNTISVDTNNSCNVLMLVEGEAIEVTVAGNTYHFHYAETIVIPAAAHSYSIRNRGNSRAKVVKAFIKDSIDQLK